MLEFYCYGFKMRQIFLLIILIAIVLDKLFPPRFFGFIGFTITNICVGFTILLLLSNLLIKKELYNIQIPAIKISIIFMIYILFNLGIAQLTGNINQSLIEGLQIFKREIFQPFLIFILAFLLSSNKKEAQYNLILSICFFVLLNVYCILQPEIYLKLLDPWYHIRFAGILGNPNRNAYILAMLMPVEIYFLKNTKVKLLKLLLVFFLIISIVVIILSGSRGGLLCVIMILFIMFFKYNTKIILLFIYLIPFIILIIYFLLKHPLFRNVLMESYSRFFIRTFFVDINTASAGRLDIWSAKLTFFWNHLNFFTLLFGFGPKASFYLGTPFPIPCHNFYLKLIFDYGLIAVIIASIIALDLFKFIKVYSHYNHEWTSVALLSILVLIIAWFFTTLSGTHDIVAFIIGLILANFRFIRNTTNEI